MPSRVALCVALLEIGVRKACRREGRVAGRRESFVERALSRAGNVRPHDIEDAPITFVGVEPVVEELTQEAATLRNAEDVRGSSAHGHIGGVEKRGRRIANRRETDAGDSRTGGRVIHLIDPAGLEAGVEHDARPSISDGKAPRLAWQ